MIEQADSPNIWWKSRDNLNFDFKIINDSASFKVFVEIKGDDGLEKLDGAVFQVRYTGPSNLDWNIDSRIKETPKGFVKMKWSKFIGYSEVNWFAIGMSIPILLATFTNLNEDIRTINKGNLLQKDKNRGSVK